MISQPTLGCPYVGERTGVVSSGKTGRGISCSEGGMRDVVVSDELEHLSKLSGRYRGHVELDYSSKSTCKWVNELTWLPT